MRRRAARKCGEGAKMDRSTWGQWEERNAHVRGKLLGKKIVRIDDIMEASTEKSMKIIEEVVKGRMVLLGVK